MKLLIAFSVLLLLASCNAATDTETTKGDTTSNGTTTEVAAPINAEKIEAGALPSYLKFKGKPEEIFQWTDKLGDNLLITALVAPYDDKEKNEFDELGQTSELHVFHYVKKDSAYKLLWKISDAEKACPFDITNAFLKNATTITDLDKDGVAETTVQYKMACRSDVSPADMKVIMHEDTTKYSLRGLMWIKASPTETFTVTEGTVNLETLPKKKDDYEQIMQSFGRYQTEKEFANAPPEFLKYARNQWMKNAIESFE